MRNLFKAIVLALEEVFSEHHMIYYDDLLIGTEFYLDGKVVNDLSEIRRYLLANEYSRPYAKASNWIRAFAYLFAGASGMMLVGGFVSGHYLEKAIDEYQ